MDTEEEGVIEAENDGYYDDAKYALEDGARVSCLVHRVFCVARQKDQQNNIFHSNCSINKKVCNLIVNNGSCKNFITQRLVKKRSIPYTIDLMKVLRSR